MTETADTRSRRMDLVSRRLWNASARLLHGNKRVGRQHLRTGPEWTLGSPFWVVILILSPFVALAGLIWLIILCVRLGRPHPPAQNP